MALLETEERIQELLARLDLPVEDTTTRDTLREALIRELGFEPSEYMLDKAWEGVQFTYENLAEAGIHSVIIEYPWGREVRYGVAGQPGLWGYESAKEWYQVYEATKP